MSTEFEEVQLRRGAAAAWGVESRPARGPRPALSVERIVDAAIATARTDGLAAVSMNRVASQLGTAAMSLYRHVSSKDELVELMVDAAIGKPAPVTSEDWRDGLNRWMDALLDRYRADPWVVEVPISGPPVLPNGLAWFEQALRCLATTGLTEAEKVGVVMLTSSLVRNYATMGVQLQAAMQASGDDTVLAYGRLVARLTDPRDFPALHATLASGVFDADEDDDSDAFEFADLEFAFARDRVLDGIDALIRRRTPADA